MVRRVVEKLLSAFEFKKESELNPQTFSEDLIRQCRPVSILAMLIATISWPLYINLDIQLIGDVPLIIYLRWGFSAVGILSFFLFAFIPKINRRPDWILYAIVFYVSIATSIIVALAGLHPSYLGGYAIVALLTSMAPIHKLPALINMLVALIIFLVVSLAIHVEYVAASETYGIINLMLSILSALAAIFIFHQIRYTSFENRSLLKIANEDLRKANELKNQLLQLAAHDLKDPLQVIIGYTDLLQARTKGDRFAEEKLRIIYRSTDRMIKLIAGFLEITSIESGKLILHKEKLDLSEVVSTAIKIQQPNAARKNQRIQDEIENHCLVLGDRMLLRQVVGHLLDNAIKYSQPGKTIQVTLENSNKTVTLKVIDEGPGIEQEDLSKLFGKFQRLSAKPTGGEISTGLGLAITKDLVELHKGTISVQSEPRKGTVFIVEFPALSERGILL